MSQLLSDLATFKTLYPYEIITKHGDTKKPWAVEIQRDSGKYVFCSASVEGGRFRPDPMALKLGKAMVFCIKGVFYLYKHKFPVVRKDECKPLNSLMSDRMKGIVQAIKDEFGGELI